MKDDVRMPFSWFTENTNPGSADQPFGTTTRTLMQQGRGNDDMDSLMFIFEEYVLYSHATPLGSLVVNLYSGPYYGELSWICCFLLGLGLGYDMYRSCSSLGC